MKSIALPWIAFCVALPLGAAAQELRSIDGSGNHLSDPTLGAAGTALRRLVPADYADGMATLAGEGRPGARTISNMVNAQPGPQPEASGASDFLWQWGQFLDHDIDLTEAADPTEPAAIPVPMGDPHFDPDHTGSMEIAFDRSVHDPASGGSPTTPRAQLNQITTWIDGSVVYGSDPERAAALRTNDGTGRLRTSAGDLLPFNTAGLPNAGSTGPELFLAGDVRANENVGLTALHTVFVREHNRHARKIRRRHRRWSGERIYQAARRKVAAEIQAITFEEFLPALLGEGAITPYTGYDPSVDPRIANVFSTAAYRFGHSALSPFLQRVDKKGRPISAGPLALRDAFFRPDRITAEGGIEPLLRGLAAQPCQRIDAMLVDDVRNFLFGPPGMGGFDLAALNIQRGRDHGLPSYNDTRAALGLARATDFSEITSDAEATAKLAEAYASVDDVDLWVGGLAEDPAPGSHLGELFHRIVVQQFEALRDGDRFWYENEMTKREQRRIRRARLSKIVRRNTKIGGELQRDVFRVE